MTGWRGIAGEAGPFRVTTLLAVLLVGLAGLAALIGIGAWAPEMQAAESGGGHALSRGATGFAGLVRLAGETGRTPRIVRNARAFAGLRDLLVITSEKASVNIVAAMRQAAHAPVLVVLPKWNTAPDPDRQGWVRAAGLLPLAEPVGVMGPNPSFTIARRPAERGQPLDTTVLPPMRAPGQLQVITGIDMAHTHDVPPLLPVITDGHGGIILARVGTWPLFVLADPDLIDNVALADEHQAAAALEMLDWLNAAGAHGIAFDVSYNGLGAKSPLRLLFEPPFAAGSACLAVALLLAGVAAFGRFGPPEPPPRAIPFGKAALVENAALMIRKAGRSAGMGGRYAEIRRQQAAALAGHAAAGRFAELADAARAAHDGESLLAAARALHAWATTTGPITEETKA